MASPALPRTLAAWGRDDFEQIFKQEAAALDPAHLPLQAGLTQGNHALTDEVEFVLLRADEQPDGLRLHAMIFYRSLIIGCACADDPTPESELVEQCEVSILIDRTTAAAQITLL